MAPSYQPRRAAQDLIVPVRDQRIHLHQWGHSGLATQRTPPLVMVHGWMDVGASFQFVVDAMAALAGPGDSDRWIVAPDWRGFGGTTGPQTDSYAFADYLGDLDGLLDALHIAGPFDLLGHSMGGNVAMVYAGVRPERVRRLVNLEGFGMPQTRPEQAPKRLLQWLDALKTPQQLRSYASADEVAERLLKNNPRLTPDKAAWLAPHWAAPRDDGRWHILGDPAHKRPNPVLPRREESIALFKRITAPVLWVEGDLTDVTQWWGDRYPRSDFEERLAVLPNLQRELLSPCGHMLHHEQPEAVAALLSRFLT